MSVASRRDIDDSSVRGTFASLRDEYRQCRQSCPWTIVPVAVGSGKARRQVRPCRIDLEHLRSHHDPHETHVLCPTQRMSA